MEKFGGEIGKKYAEINRAGRNAIREGAVNEFDVIPEQLKNRFNISLSLEKNSEEILKKVVLSKIEELERQSDIKLFLAGRDFPIHITVLEGLLKNPSLYEKVLGERESVFNEIKDDEKLRNELSRTLLENPIDFKYLLIDKGNIILTSIDIPQPLLEARESVSDRYTESNLKTLPMKNILHMTISRINKLPTNEKDLLLYEQEMLKLRHVISKNPLQLTPGGFYMDSTYNILTKSKQID